MSLSHKVGYLHNQMSGEALCSAMLSTTALLQGNVNGIYIWCCSAQSCRGISALMKAAGVGCNSAQPSAKFLGEAEVPFQLGLS